MAGLKSCSCDQAQEPFSDKLQKVQPQTFSSFLWTPFLFLSLGLGASGKDSTPPRVVQGTLGGPVTLPLNISGDAKIEHVIWSSSKNIFLLVYSNKDIQILVKSYQGRLNISQSYSLHISNLTQEDTGSYTAQINQKNKTDPDLQEFILRVYEQLQEPRVVVKSVDITENANCTVTLLCTVKGAMNDVQYSWTPKDTHSSEQYDSSLLTISRSPCDPDLPHTCTARNPVSQSSSHPVHAWKFCTAANSGASGRKTMGDTIVGMLGEPLTLTHAVSTSRYVKNVVWMFNSSIISKEWEEAATEDPPIKPKDPKNNRVWISGQDYSLKINQLEMEDAGIYHVYSCSEASEVTSVRQITLLIYKRLKKPTITQSPIHTKDGSCKMNLTCSVEDAESNVTYTWASLKKGAVVIQRGPHLNVSWKSGESHPNFTCTASNPVSNNSRQFLSWTICSGPEWNMNLLIALTLVVFILSLGICGVCIWKKGRCGFLRLRASTNLTPAFSSSQAEAPDGIPGYEKLNTLPETTRHWPMPTIDTSSDSNATTEEDEERTIHGRDDMHGLDTQEDSEYDLTFRGQAECDVTQDDTVVEPKDDGDLNYAQVTLNWHGMTPDPQRKESSNTIYCSVQKPRKKVPPLQEDALESPEISIYENFT